MVRQYPEIDGCRCCINKILFTYAVSSHYEELIAQEFQQRRILKCEM